MALSLLITLLIELCSNFRTDKLLAARPTIWKHLMVVEVPVIRSSRLILSGFEESDAADVYYYASSPNVAKTVSWNEHTSEQDSRDFIRLVRSRSSLESGKVRVAFAIRKQEDQLAIGSISFDQHSMQEGRIDYALAETHWGKGIVTEAARAVIYWAFHYLPELTAVRSGGLSKNLASIRVMEKCGMRLDKRYSIRFPKFNNEKLEVSEYIVTRMEFNSFL